MKATLAALGLVALATALPPQGQSDKGPSGPGGPGGPGRPGPPHGKPPRPPNGPPSGPPRPPHPPPPHGTPGQPGEPIPGDGDFNPLQHLGANSPWFPGQSTGSFLINVANCIRAKCLRHLSGSARGVQDRSGGVYRSPRKPISRSGGVQRLGVVV